MNLKLHYDNLYEKAIQQIRLDEYKIDPEIDNPLDNRYGITLLIRPGKQVRENILQFLKRFKTIEPEQHYYTEDNIHITVMAIISCYSGFELSQISVQDYAALVEKSVQGIRPFNIQMAGLTASPSCIMVQGFPADESLNQIRNNLRIHFKNSDLEQTIDKRYVNRGAHSTIMRFRKILDNKPDFLQLIEEFRNQDFGTFRVTELETVFTDWFHSKSVVKTLFKNSIE